MIDEENREIGGKPLAKDDAEPLLTGADPQTETFGDDAESSEYGPFAYPEGFKEDATVMKEFRALARAANLPQAQAQKFVDIGVKMIQNQNAAMVQAVHEMKQNWNKEIRNDPEFGRQSFQRTIHDANIALREFGSDKLVTNLREWNLDNHPELVRCFAKIGRYMSENSSPSGEAPAERREKTLADFYSPM